jgi:pilus assembly protein CpaF
MFDEQVCEILEALVRARRSLLVSGGTGSGKTTLVNALIHACDPADRIIIIEDTYELRPDHPHVVNLHARDSASAGSGALAALVRQALRIRPDRIVVGEVRGEEVVDLLTALNTGHVGAFSTVHANSASQVPQRLAFLAARTAISAVAIEHAVRDGIDAVVHLTRQPRRRVAEIAVTLRDSDQCLVPAWSSEVSIDAAAASRLAQLCES